MNRRRNRFGAAALSTTLAGLVRDRNWEQQLDVHRIFPDWERLVDEETAAHARPVKVVREVLWLEVDNSAWAQQLQFKKLPLLERLNAYLDTAHIADIRFTVGQSRRRPPPAEGQSRPPSIPTAAEIERFEKQLAAIDDEETRAAMVQLWYLTRACGND